MERTINIGDRIYVPDIEQMWTITSIIADKVTYTDGKGWDNVKDIKENFESGMYVHIPKPNGKSITKNDILILMHQCIKFGIARSKSYDGQDVKKLYNEWKENLK